MASITNNISCFINGSEPELDSTCPLRSPTAAIQIPDLIIEVYQERIDALINQLGKNVVLEFEPSRSVCPNCIFDNIGNRSSGRYKTGGPRYFEQGQRCPYCKGAGFLNTAVSKCIKCLTKWSPKDVERYGINLNDSGDIVRLKTFYEDADDMVRAISAIVDHDIADILPLKVKLIKGPFPAGLRDSRYCISFWRLSKE